MRKVIGILFLLVFGSSSFATEPGPEQLIRATADRVLGDIRINLDVYREDPRKLYALVNEVVLPHFDFMAMTDLALGRYSNKVDATQKSMITNEFKALLVRTYGKALLEYNDQAIVYLPMEGSEADGEVTVRTEIEQAGGFPIPLHYRLKHSDDRWRVYDISVDDISLVTNYRSSFARQIRKNGVEGLVEVLKTRNQEE